MTRFPPVLLYTLLRLVAFAVPLAILVAIGFDPFISAAIAALIGLSLSILLLRRTRDAVSTSLHAARHKGSGDDEKTEDTALDTKS